MKNKIKTVCLKVDYNDGYCFIPAGSIGTRTPSGMYSFKNNKDDSVSFKEETIKSNNVGLFEIEYEEIKSPVSFIKQIPDEQLTKLYHCVSLCQRVFGMFVSNLDDNSFLNLGICLFVNIIENKHPSQFKFIEIIRSYYYGFYNKEAIHSIGYWFTTNKDGHKERIRFLEFVIKDLRKEIYSRPSLTSPSLKEFSQ